MAGNRSWFSKYYMTGSPVFSINFTNQSIKNSQAILKCFIDLKSETSVNQTRKRTKKSLPESYVKASSRVFFGYFLFVKPSVIK